MTLHLQLTNNGTAPLPGAQLSVSTTSPYLTLASSQAPLGTLASGGSVLAELDLTCDGDTPPSTSAELQLAITADHGGGSQHELAFQIGDPLYAPSGPDDYGYTAYDPHDAVSGWSYDWIEICPDEGGSGVDTGIDGDDEVSVHSLPFSFTYYGQSHDQIWIDSNGMVSFGGTTSSDYSNSGIPNLDGPQAMIAPYWEDLNPTAAGFGGIWTWHDSANHRFVVQWQHVAHYGDPASFETFQLVLLDPAHHPTESGDGIIVFQYKELSGAAEGVATIGIENPTETGGLQYAFNGSYDENAHPLADEFFILLRTGEAVELESPSGLNAGPPDGEGDVLLSWNSVAGAGLAGPVVFAPGAVQSTGGKPDILREEDRLQQQWWQTTDELDEFTAYAIFRDGVQVGLSGAESYLDRLPSDGTFAYTICALYDEGMSEPCAPASVTWTGLTATLPVEPLRYELVSLPLRPEHCTAEDLFGGLAGLEIVYRNDGAVYWPGQGVDQIGELDLEEAYRLFMNAPNTLDLAGGLIGTEVSHCFYEDQWNWMGYPRNQEMELTSALAGIENVVEILMDDQGRIWWPELGVNDLGSLRPGDGYMVYVSAEVCFVLPEAGSSPPLVQSRPTLRRPTVNGMPTPTGLPYPVLVRLDRDLLERGAAVVDLYDGTRHVGRGGVLQELRAAVVTAWQDPGQLGRGFRPGREIRCVVRDEEGRELSLAGFNGVARYGEGSHALLKLTGAEELPTEFSLAPIHPNPFNSQALVRVDLPRRGELRVRLYNTLGREVLSLARGEHEAGRHTFRLQGTQLASGLYFVAVDAGEQGRAVRKALLLK